MPLIPNIVTQAYKITIAKVKRGLVPLDKQPVLPADVNPVITWINDRSDVTTNTNVNTATGTTTAQTAVLNTISGTITSATLATAIGTAAITVTNSNCTTNSTVLCVISSTTTATATVITSVVPGNGSFVINLYHAVAPTGTPSVKIKFIIL